MVKVTFNPTYFKNLIIPEISSGSNMFKIHAKEDEQMLKVFIELSKEAKELLGLIKITPKIFNRRVKFVSKKENDMVEILSLENVSLKTIFKLIELIGFNEDQTTKVTGFKLKDIKK